MQKQDVLNTIKLIREKSSKRKFSQTVDLVINLKGINIKKQEEKVELYIQLPHKIEKKSKLGAFVDSSLKEEAKKYFDTVISKEEFDIWKSKIKEQKSLAREHDFFIAQADLMAKMAGVFGKTLGSRGKMPNPKAGCVVPRTANFGELSNKLKNTIRIQTKSDAVIRAGIAKESMKDEDIADNMLSVYNAVLEKLPQHKNNILNVGLKFTMGPLVTIGSQDKEDKQAKKTKK